MEACPACTFENDPSADVCEMCFAGLRQEEEEAPSAEIVRIDQGDEIGLDGVGRAYPIAFVADGSAAAFLNETSRIEELALWIAKTHSHISFRGEKVVPFSFTLDEFVKRALQDELCESKQDAVERLQVELVDRDVVNTSPYILHPVLQSLEKPVLLRFGRRYFAETGPSKGKREVFKCQTCEHESLHERPYNERQEPMAFEFLCDVCTVRNEIPAARDQRGGVSQLAGMVFGAISSAASTAIFGSREKAEEAEEAIRTSIQLAVLRHSVPTSSFDSLSPPLCELFARDRSFRGEKGFGKSLETTYAPLVMKLLRKHFGIDEDFFCESLFESKLEMQGSSGGRSGSLLFFSQDKHFVVKTISKAEMTILRGFLKRYYEHVMANPDTLLPRFLGMYKIRGCHIVVMTNVFDTSMEIEMVFDLKGSTANRFVDTIEQVQSLKQNKKLPALKDLNWRTPFNPIDEEANPGILAQLCKDTEMLQELNLMDFSLLVGIAESVPGSEGTFPVQRNKWQSHFGGLPCKDGKVRFFGIIDILQTFDLQKKAERFMKTKVLSPLRSYVDKPMRELKCPFCSFEIKKPELRKDEGNYIQVVKCIACHQRIEFIDKTDSNISSINPIQYQRRFMKFMMERVFPFE